MVLEKVTFSPTPPAIGRRPERNSRNHGTWQLLYILDNSEQDKKHLFEKFLFFFCSPSSIHHHSSPTADHDLQRFCFIH